MNLIISNVELHLRCYFGRKEVLRGKMQQRVSSEVERNDTPNVEKSIIFR